jgi:hypothetical protein
MRPRARFLLPLLVVLAVAPALADTPRQGILYVHPDKLLSVRFPNKPTETTPEAPNHDKTIRIKTATSLDGEHGYSVSTTVYPVPTGPGTMAPDPIAPGTPMPANAVAAIKTAIDQTIDNSMSSIKGRVLARKSITLDGLLGSEIQFEAIGRGLGRFRGIGRVFVSPIPLTTYIAIAIQFDGKPDPGARGFLDSLHLGKQVEIQP